MIDGVGRMQPVALTAGEARMKTSDGQAPVARAAGGQADAAPEVLSARIGAEMAAGPPVDAGRVAALRLAIEAGSYRAEPMAIADAMLRQAGA